MTLREFLDKECPKEGGCMVVEFQEVGKNRPTYFLCERFKAANGDMFLLSGQFYFDYEFLWEETEREWNIIYKREVA